MPFGLGGLGPNLFNNSLQNFFNQGFGMQSGFQFPPSFPPIGGGPGQGGQTLQGLQNALQQAVAGGDPNAIKTAVTNLDKFEEGFEEALKMEQMRHSMSMKAIDAIPTQ